MVALKPCLEYHAPSRGVKRGVTHSLSRNSDILEIVAGGLEISSGNDEIIRQGFLSKGHETFCSLFGAPDFRRCHAITSLCCD